MTTKNILKPLNESASSFQVVRRGGEEPADQSFATTLAHGLDVLSAFRAEEGALSNRELAERTSLSRPTVSRLTHTLEVLGYLKRDANGLYKLGSRVLSIAYPLLARLRIRQLVRPLMKDFAAFTGGTVSIAMPLGINCIYVETIRTTDVSSHVPETGFTISMALTAVGRSLLSLYSDAEFCTYRDAAMNDDATTWSHVASNIESGIASCRDRGFCLSLGEWRSDIYGAAAPLFRTPDGDCFSVNCGIPAFRFTADAVERECGPRIAALAQSIRSLAADQTRVGVASV
ncbi:IclR family transcriptional regulator [Acidiphilium iwatense]|uniref:IclR family transcriptional regulator n=1 Tax=Acidiphilium iwatense TaxID=768198 RepID=A0ABS9E1B6_9PROT|nr:IclR family transcriptional regulator [Acidiphilium iwatense]MCF3947830.1 IclR family transcriptional regulator [Acidiphilium iwatense]